jgi:hypothetical protein
MRTPAAALSVPRGLRRGTQHPGLIPSLAMVCAVGGAAVLGAGVVRFGAPQVGMLAVGGLVALLAALRIEVMYVALYASAFVAPVYFGNGLWPAVASLTVLFVAAYVLVQGKSIVVSGFLLVYCACYGLAAAAGDWNPASLPALRGFVTPVLLTLVTASVARDPKVRRNLVLLFIPFVAIQIPVAAWQSLRGIGTYGQAGFQRFGDYVTGTLGSSASGTLALVTVALATVMFAIALERVWRPKVAGAAALVFASAGVLSVARAVFIFVPVALVTVLLTSGGIARRSVGTRRILATAATLVIATPAVVFAMQALYPGVTHDISSLDKVREYLYLPQSGPNPERAGQLEIAVSEVKSSNMGTALLGEGVGKTWLSSDPHVSSSVDYPLVLEREQFTNSVWTPRVLIETGLLGVAAFCALMAYMVRIALDARRRTADHTLDSAILLALPALAALTFVGSFYQTVLDLPSYATVFWVFLGLGLAIQRGSAAATTPS